MTHWSLLGLSSDRFLTFLATVFLLAESALSGEGLVWSTVDLAKVDLVKTVLFGRIAFELAISQVEA